MLISQICGGLEISSSYAKLWVKCIKLKNIKTADQLNQNEATQSFHDSIKLIALVEFRTQALRTGESD